jgi:hypothetical protein
MKEQEHDLDIRLRVRLLMLKCGIIIALSYLTVLIIGAIEAALEL